MLGGRLSKTRQEERERVDGERRERECRSTANVLKTTGLRRTLWMDGFLFIER